MPNNVTTKHLIVDLKTGSVYGMKLDGEGKCLGLELYDVVLQSARDGHLIDRFGQRVNADRLFDNSGHPVLNARRSSLPQDITTSAIELTQAGESGEIFTIVWPKKEEADKGVLPLVVKKPLPVDLVKAGIAPAPKSLKGQKGAGVDGEEELKTALKNIDSMIGLDKAKHDIKQNIALAQFNKMKQELGLSVKPMSRHMVFTGNPGTGKTTFAREVAKVYHALGFIDNPTVHEVKREDLVGGFIGQTALKTKEQIDKAKGGILFIDEAYALSRDAGPGADSKDFGREAIDTLVASMENMREDLVVIVAGYPEPMKKFLDSNEGLKSRFMTYIGFEDYSVMQLGQILDSMLKERGYSITAEAREKAMDLMENEKNRSKKDFGNGRTVRNLVEKAEKELALRLQAENKLNKNHGLSEADIKAALTTVTLKDVANVSLDGLSAKVQYKPIGFETSIIGDKQVSNDMKPFAPAMPTTVPSAKKVLRNHFGM